MKNVSVRRVAAGEASVALAENQGQVVDVREFAEYQTERVPGAILAPLSSFEQQLGQIERGRPVYLLCRSGQRAQQAAERLARRGYEDLRVIEGGLQAWAAGGYPIEYGTGRVWGLERQVRLVAGVLVLAGVLLSLISPWFVLLAGFIGAGLTFSALTDTCGMGLLLARLPYNRAGAAACNLDGPSLKKE